MRERAILVTTVTESSKTGQIQDLAAELAELSWAAGLQAVDSFSFLQTRPNAGLFVGRGKADLVAASAKKNKASVIVFQPELSPSQQRNLEEIFQMKTLDRTQLILDIFASRARSMEGKLQVELAQLQYLLPRLAGKGVYLSRLGGGVGTRGPGEQKLEVDRRRIRERVARLSRGLAELQKKRAAAIQKKKEKDLPLIALVGYTNAGKSSLFNALTQSETFVKNQQFSTLDTTTRVFELPDNQKSLLVDTVGFVRNLPHHLIESFKATLEEVMWADLLLHVVDVSRHDRKEMIEAVENVLGSLEAQEKPTFLILNKCDLLSAGDFDPSVFSEKKLKGVFLVSAKSGEGLEALKKSISAYTAKQRRLAEIFIPESQKKLLPVLYEQAQVLGRVDEQKGSRFRVWLTPKVENQLKAQSPEIRVTLLGSEAIDTR